MLPDPYFTCGAGYETKVYDHMKFFGQELNLIIIIV